MAEIIDKLVSELSFCATQLRTLTVSTKGASEAKAEKERLELELLESCGSLAEALEELAEDQAQLEDVLGGNCERFITLMQAIAKCAGTSQLVAEDPRLQTLTDLVLTLGERLKGELRARAEQMGVPGTGHIDAAEEDDDDYEGGNEVLEEEEEVEPKADFAATSLSPTEVLKAKIIGSEDINGVTWYHVRVREGSEERFFAKTYADFKQFHFDLEEHANPCIIIPEFPRIGKFNIAYALQLNDWKKQQKTKLQAYLSKLFFQLPSTDCNLDVAAFLGRIAVSGAVVYHQDKKSESV